MIAADSIITEDLILAAVHESKRGRGHMSSRSASGATLWTDGATNHDGLLRNLVSDAEDGMFLPADSKSRPAQRERVKDGECSGGGGASSGNVSDAILRADAVDITSLKSLTVDSESKPAQKGRKGEGKFGGGNALLRSASGAIKRIAAATSS